ncbi:MAG: LysR family transcriptional regulator [Ahrensia sp.]|nr:LysR family transcriptional regulator [Ahrensia sp.]
MSYFDSLKSFVRVFDLGSMSAAARDQRVSPAVISSRIAELEQHLNVRLFNRTTRSLQPTQQGKIFYQGATEILETIERSENAIAENSNNPRGSIFVGAPLGVGRRFIAPHVPHFKDQYPLIDVRLRLSDRNIDIAAEGIDVAFSIRKLPDSNLKMKIIEDCPRVLCAAPSYIARKGMPIEGRDLITQQHDCLLLRFPGTTEFRWSLKVGNQIKDFDVKGPFESDDGDVLTQWALDGRGIINSPLFEVAEYLANGTLMQVCQDTPPTSVKLACLYPHKRLQDPKIRLFIDFMVAKCREELKRRENL